MESKKPAHKCQHAEHVSTGPTSSAFRVPLAAFSRFGRRLAERYTSLTGLQSGDKVHDQYFLRSMRLGFRGWTADDFPLAKVLWGNIKVTELIDARGQLSDEQIRGKLANEIVTGQRAGIQYWPIFNLQSGDFVGCCGLRPYPAISNTLELGFHICEEQWGNGYATEAARTAMDHAFRHLETQALFAGHNPNNEASRTLLAKLGFAYTHDEFYEPTGLQHPSYLLTREDYLNKR